MGSDASNSYDYIIVGGGSAGCVLANRLSGDPSVKVCLVEVGPSDRSNIATKWLINTPLGMLNLIRNPKYNWMYQFEPEPSLNNRAMPCPRGRLLGGSSSINASHYVRGHYSDYDLWASLGATGWSYDEVLPFFKKSERWEGEKSPFHGEDGELTVAHQRSPHPSNTVFLDACKQMQLPATGDFNGGTQEGCGYYHVNQIAGERMSAARAFLHAALDRPNLTVITGALVSRITLEGRRATGISLARNGEPANLLARREVILAAGAINSPQLLLLSGIGPAQELHRHGITLHHDLPGVGENLQDHPVVTVAYESNDAGLYGLSWRALPWIVKAPLQYVFGRRGPLATSGFESGCFARSSPEVEVPDVQISFSPANMARLALGELFPHGHGYSIHVALLRPKSRGRLRLHSAKADEQPKVQANFFDDPDDMAALLRGVRLTRGIATAEAFERKYHPRDVQPGAAVQTQEQLTAFIRATVGTAFHPVGTCKMGTDDMAVVDPQLRVHGFDALRVIDASVMPTLIGGNTNAPTMMIAEKGADMIRRSAPAI